MVGSCLPQISIIIPILNEAATLDSFLKTLCNVAQNRMEIIVVDGGSHDASREIASRWVDRVITAPVGRAEQMNAGAAQATSELLLFLHADTVMRQAALADLASRWVATQRRWGFFNVQLSSRKPVYRVIEFFMNRRSTMTGIATGDQAIFVAREIFESLEGYAQIPLMEDIDLCKRLKRISKPLCIPSPVITSSRRWENRGVFTTILLMWRLRLAFFLGVPAEQLVNKYYPARPVPNKGVPGQPR